MLNSRNKTKRFRKFDYNQKKLENPFFKRKEKINKSNNFKLKIIIIVIIILFIFSLWFLYFSSFAKITKTNITGLNRISSEDIYNLTEKQIRSRRLLILPQNNLLFFDNKELKKILEDKYRFEEIEINKNWPHELEVIIKEKPFACIWNEGEKFYYADSEGYVLEEINPLNIRNKKYPLIYNESKQKISNYKIQINTKYIDYAKQLSKKLNDKSLDINISRFIIDKDIDTIKIETKEGTKISFSTQNDIDEQIEKLIIIKNEKLKDSFFTKKYIDLRFGDKVYYQ